VKRSFGELDGYIREAKRRTLKILVFGIHPAEFAKMGLVSLSSMLDDTISWKGRCRTKAVYWKSVGMVNEGGEVGRPLLYATTLRTSFLMLGNAIDSRNNSFKR